MDWQKARQKISSLFPVDEERGAVLGCDKTALQSKLDDLAGETDTAIKAALCKIAGISDEALAKTSQAVEPPKNPYFSPERYGIVGASPSNAAKTSLYRHLQTRHPQAPVFRDNRPIQNQDVPLPLLCEYFGEYIDLLETVEISREDERMVARLAELLAQFWSKGEDEKKQQVNDFLQSYLGESVRDYILTSTCSKNNGGVSGSTNDKDWQAISVEFKGELDEAGCPPSVQNAVHYYTFINSDPYSSLLKGSPMFSIEQVGCELRVGGLMITDKVVYYPFTDSLVCINHLACMPHRMDRIARALKSVKIVTSKLMTAYKHAEVQQEEFLNLPYALLDGRFLRDTIQRRSACCYTASDQDNVDSFIKYTRNYPVEVNNILSGNGLVPRLRTHRMLKGGFEEVVLELLDSKDGWMDLLSLALKSPTLKDAALAAALDLLRDIHRAGFVLGDTKPDNIMIRVEDGFVMSAKAVDLDWSGRLGEATYPSYINHADLHWPDGVERNAPMSTALDETFLQTSLASLLEEQIAEQRRQQVAALLHPSRRKRQAELVLSPPQRSARK